MIALRGLCRLRFTFYALRFTSLAQDMPNPFCVLDARHRQRYCCANATYRAIRRANMRDYTDHALDTARTLGASYADVRVSEKRNQHISVKNGLVEAVAESNSAGFGVRVLVNGAWGF